MTIYRFGAMRFHMRGSKLPPPCGAGVRLQTGDGAAVYTRNVKIEGMGRSGKVREETLEIRSLNNARAARARKGKAADLGFKTSAISRVE